MIEQARTPGALRPHELLGERSTPRDPCRAAAFDVTRMRVQQTTVQFAEPAAARLRTREAPHADAVTAFLAFGQCVVPGAIVERAAREQVDVRAPLQQLRVVPGEALPNRRRCPDASAVRRSRCGSCEGSQCGMQARGEHARREVAAIACTTGQTQLLRG